MNVQQDKMDQPYIEWEQAPGGFKRAWIQRRTDPEKDWAKAPRYLNVARIEKLGAGPVQPTDFPIYSNEFTDDEILMAFVVWVSAISHHRLPI
jgi:hypothetical protein